MTKNIITWKHLILERNLLAMQDCCKYCVIYIRGWQVLEGIYDT